MEHDATLSKVLAEYPGWGPPRRIDSIAGGFSGARIWRIETAAGPICLRRWPAEHPTRERLEYIQSVLWHVSRVGFCRVPAPLKTRDDLGFVLEGGRFWELTPWLPGRADFRAAPSRARLQAALATLAGFHLAAATFVHPQTHTACSPTLADRARRVAWLQQGGCETLRTAVDADRDWPALRSRARRLLRLFWSGAKSVERSLAEAIRIAAPMQPVIRDIWHEHVLFEGDAVTGFIDFGAMKPECVAADLARLLGSLAGDDAAAWEAGLAAYESMRPLGSAERRLMKVFDTSAVLLGGLEWLGWIYLDRRQFDDRTAIETRLDEILARLERLANGSL